MRAALKNILRRTPLYGVAKELYRHTANRGQLHTRNQLIHFYGKLLGKGAVVFDVGANRGEFANAFLRLGAMVYAVEPHPVCIRELRALYRRNPRFKLLECALGAAPGEAQLYLGENGMDNMSTLSDDFRREVKEIPGLSLAGWNESVTVKVDTLDRLIGEYGIPDFCKMDVEGFDLEVLRGLSTPLPMLQFEYHPWAVEKAVQCVEYLSALGTYQFNVTMSQSRDESVELQPEWSDSGQTIALLRGRVIETQSLGDVLARRSTDRV